MHHTEYTERAATLIEEARQQMAASGRTLTRAGLEQIMAKLADAMSLADEAGEPVLYAVAHGLQARAHAALGHSRFAVTHGSSAIEQLREVGLSLEASRLERALSPLMSVDTGSREAVPPKYTFHGGLGEYVGAEEVTEEATEEAKERDMIMAIKAKITGAATSTGTGVVDAFKEGLLISGSQQVSDRIVAVFHAKLGHHVPMASSLVGQQVERVAIPALVHLVAGLMPDKIPGAETVQKTCMRAITGVAKDDGDALIQALLPVFGEILKMSTTDGFDLASMMTTTTVEQMAGQEQRRALAKQPEMSALAEAMSRGFEAAEDGEPVEVMITMKRGKRAATMEDNGIVPPAPEPRNPTR